MRDGVAPGAPGCAGVTLVLQNQHPIPSALYTEPYQESSEAERPVKVLPGGAPARGTGEAQYEGGEVERGVCGEKADGKQRRHHVKRPDHAGAQAQAGGHEQREGRLPCGVEGRRAHEKWNGTVGSDGVEHPRRLGGKWRFRRQGSRDLGSRCRIQCVCFMMSMN